MTDQEYTKKSFGAWAENFVASYLQKEGFVIVDRNYRKRFGEIDLIAQKDRLLIFVEVKARKKTTAMLSELILENKKKKIILTAKDFLTHHNVINDSVVRFDVALVEGEGSRGLITYIPNAFQDE